jgi:hypothetical protein
LAIEKGTLAREICKVLRVATLRAGRKSPLASAREICKVLRVATAEGRDDFFVGTYGIPVMVTAVTRNDQIKRGEVGGGGAPR